MKAQPYLMHNQVQHYAWGTRDSAAFIPRLLGLSPEGGRPYAELWMGAHPKAPSEIMVGDKARSLHQLVVEQPSNILGQAVSEKFSGAFPFLFKVLSIAAPLSIQAHPNKRQAELLHARDPEHYPDANHKPEIAVALDALDALVGFKPFAAIAHILHTYPEIAGFVGQEHVVAFPLDTVPPLPEQKQRLRQMYTTLMMRAVQAPDMLMETVTSLDARLRERADLSAHEALFLRVRQAYPGPDVGVLALFFLNLVHLDQGEAIFLKPGIPHAYLSGNLVECMANSDNVIRAGLTSKFKDVHTLIDILTYDVGPIPVLKAGKKKAGGWYRVPVPDFQLGRWPLHAGEVKHETTQNRPYILLVIQGKMYIQWQEGAAQKSAVFARGQSVFIPAVLDAFEIVSQSEAEVFVATVPEWATL